MNARELGKMIYGNPTNENAEKAKKIVDGFFDGFKHIKGFIERQKERDCANTDSNKLRNENNIAVEGCAHKSPYGRRRSIDI